MFLFSQFVAKEFLCRDLALVETQSLTSALLEKLTFFDDQSTRLFVSSLIGLTWTNQNPKNVDVATDVRYGA